MNNSYQALMSKLETLREKYEAGIADVLREAYQRDVQIAERIAPSTKKKKVHWTQTAAGKKILKRMQKARWGTK